MIASVRKHWGCAGNQPRAKLSLQVFFLLSVRIAAMEWRVARTYEPRASQILFAAAAPTLQLSLFERERNVDLKNEASSDDAYATGGL